MAERIGFIGIGIMGKPMCRNLVKAGYELVIHNRSQANVDELVAESDKITRASTPREVAEQVDLVITMLPDSPDVKQVVFGENGLLEAMGPGKLLVDMSTIAPAAAIEINAALTERGSSALDAPVSGGEMGAINGTLSIMVGGSAADFDNAHAVFESVGKTIVHVGDSGAGQMVKACNQIVVAINYAAVSEALVLGSKAGVDPLKIVEVLNGGLAASRVMEMRGASMAAHQFEPGFRINLHRKDLGIIADTGKTYNVPLPVTSVVSQLFESVASAGNGDLDHSAVITAIEDLAHHKVGEKA